MKSLLLTFLFLVYFQLISAQVNAISETGDEVILHEDGTWNYINDSLSEEIDIENSVNGLVEINMK